MAKTIGSFDLASLKNLRDDVTQYFWFESDSSSAWGSGAHVTLYPESQFTDSTNPNYMKGQNIIMNTDGFSIRNGALPMMVLDNDSLDFNAVDTSLGTYTTMATFGLTGATIGQTSNAHSVIDVNGQRFYASNGTTQLANIGYGEGQAQSGTATAPYYTFGMRATGSTIGNYSFATGYNTIASGYSSHSEGRDTVASGQDSHAEGNKCNAIGIQTHAEGDHTTASGWYSHSAGYYTIASSRLRTVIGSYNLDDQFTDTFTGDGVTTVFYLTHTAYGGIRTGSPDVTVNGNPVSGVSFNFGNQISFPTAPSNGDVIKAVYNTTNSIFIIGNGKTDSARSNALTVGWDGKVRCNDVIASNLVGEIKAYAGNTVPTGWLECNGQAVSRTTYPQLFQAIGTRWGAGNGSTTFNLPNLKGKVMVGQDTSDADFDVVGESHGSKTHVHTTGDHTLTVSEIPAHNHAAAADTTYKFITGQGNMYCQNDKRLAGTNSSGVYYCATQDGTHGVGEASTTQNRGGGGKHNHGNTGSGSSLQPYAVVKYIICAA